MYPKYHYSTISLTKDVSLIIGIITNSNPATHVTCWGVISSRVYSPMTNGPNCQHHGVLCQKFQFLLTFGVYRGNIESGIYVENIVQHVLLIFSQKDDEIFQQDNANSYKKDVLLNLQCKTLQFTWWHDCQVYLPLNIQEHNGMFNQLTYNFAALHENVHRTFNNILQDCSHNLYDHMPVNAQDFNIQREYLVD